MEFGLFKWRPGIVPRGGVAPGGVPVAASVDRVLKEGAKVLKRYYAELPDTVAGVLAVARKMAFGEAGERGAEFAAAAANGVAVGDGAGAARVAAAATAFPPVASPLRHRPGAAAPAMA